MSYNKTITYVCDDIQSLPLRIFEKGECWLKPNISMNKKLLNYSFINKNDRRLIDLIWKKENQFFCKTMFACDIKDLSEKIGGVIEKRFKGLVFQKNEFSAINVSEIQIFGILNITPDSFYDGDKWTQNDRAFSHAEQMIADGASVIDIGGESTKPYAQKVDIDEECRRVLPLINSLSTKGYIISVDTRNTEVMQRAIDNGAKIINDVSGMSDPLTARIISENNVGIVIMHMKGEPGTMQKNPKYEFAPIDIFKYLEAKVDYAISQGIKRENIAIDPGFGFGKSPKHNMQIISWLSMYQTLGVSVMLGASRKSSIGLLSKGEPPNQRLGGSLAISTIAQIQGVQLIRVHDVFETNQAIKLTKSIFEEM